MADSFEKKKADSVAVKQVRNAVEVSISPYRLRRSHPAAPAIYPSIDIDSGITSGPIRIDELDVMLRIAELEHEIAELQDEIGRLTWLTYADRE